MKRLAGAKPAMPLVSMLAIFGGAVMLPGSAVAEEAVPRVSEDGTLHTAPLTIPPSDLWSSEFKAAYAQFATGKLFNQNFPIPAKDAPQAEWDKFTVWNDGELAAPLAYVREHYPVDEQDTKLAGVRVGIVTPKGGVPARNKKRVLINLHGGGFVLNAGLSLGLVESIPVASLGGIKVITLDYRQAPRNKYPAASEDVAAVYQELLKQYSPKSIGIYGCSAGGFLAAQAAAWFQSKGLPPPGGIGVLCATAGPFEARGDSKLWAAGMVPGSQPPTAAAMQAMRPMFWYMEGVDPKDAVANPGISDAVLAKFPPTLLLAGTRELAFSPVVSTHARLLKLGVDSSLYVMEGAPHGAYVMAHGSPEARDANAYIARWFDERLAP